MLRSHRLCWGCALFLRGAETVTSQLAAGVVTLTPSDGPARFEGSSASGASDCKHSKLAL